MISDVARATLRWAQSVSRGERFYRAEIRCPHTRLGNRNAAFVVNPTLLATGNIIYSFGIGTDVSFDLECIRSYSSTVHAFDPTPRSRAWLMGQDLPCHFIPHSFGIADHDGTIDLYPPLDPSHVSYSLVAREGARVTCPVYRLATIMAMYGHDHLDLLKLDIEGGEYTVLADILRDRLPIRQICVEFHHRWKEVGAHATDIAVNELRASGYQLFSVSPSGEEFSFLK